MITTTVELINNIIYLAACYGKIWDVDVFCDKAILVSEQTGETVASFIVPQELNDEIRAIGWEMVKQKYLAEANSPERLIHNN